MNPAWVEPLWIILVPGGSLLWAVGGTYWTPFRRFLYPLLLAGVLAAAGIAWWTWWWTAIFTSFAAHLGYGDGVRWGRRWLVGLAYGFSCSWMTASFPAMLVWTGVSAILFTGLLWLTRRYNWFPHKLVELLHGFWHPLAVVWIVTH